MYLKDKISLKNELIFEDLLWRPHQSSQLFNSSFLITDIDFARIKDSQTFVIDFGQSKYVANWMTKELVEFEIELDEILFSSNSKNLAYWKMSSKLTSVPKISLLLLHEKNHLYIVVGKWIKNKNNIINLRRLLLPCCSASL